MTLLVAALVALAAAAPAVDVHDAVAAAGFPELAAPAAAAARPTLRMDLRRIRGSVPARTSRLGGAPDLPRGFRWPRCAGRPQTFLGQVRLRDLPREGRALRRLGGRLLLFTDVELETPGRTYGIDAGRCVRIVRVPAGTPTTRRSTPRRTLRLRPHAVRFVARPDVPDALDRGLGVPLQDEPFDDDRWEAWFDLRNTLLGRPGIAERGPRLLGYPDAPNGTDPCWDRSQRPRGAWRLLLGVDDVPGFGFEVADAGSLQVLISPADLRAGRFDRVCGRLDSA